MRAVITGAAGFVGSTLVDSLLADPAVESVIGVDSFTSYYNPEIKKANISGAVENERFQLHWTDIATEPLAPLLEGATHIFHQAGQPGVRNSWGSGFLDYVNWNINATQRLLEAATSSDSLERFVYASSSSVYGNAEKYPTNESDPPAPFSPYGVTKLAAEHLCSLYAENFGVPTVSLRYFTVYGPRQRPDMAFHRFIERAVRGQTIEIYGDGRQIRDFTFVDDVVQANKKAALVDSRPGIVLNVCGGSSVTVNEILDILRNELGGLDVRYIDSIAGDVYQTGGDRSLIEATLDWKPVTSIEEGIARQAKHVLDNQAH